MELTNQTLIPPGSSIAHAFPITDAEATDTLESQFAFPCAHISANEPRQQTITKH
jgi:hypothetical protein